MTDQNEQVPGQNVEIPEGEAPTVREVPDGRSRITGGYVVVDALGARGAGGANQAYHVLPVFEDPSVALATPGATLLFPGCDNIDELRRCGVVTNEALLAIVADRLRGFQSGAFACAQNAAALSHVECALAKLLDRTRDRRARGVEGQSVV